MEIKEIYPSGLYRSLICRTYGCAPTWAVQALQSFGSPVPSQDTVFRVLESISENKITQFINQQLQALPHRLQKLKHSHRPKNVYLIIDFHRDPSYTKKFPKGVTKGQPKDILNLRGVIS